ncbi:exodeoxyribonuclease V subunit gamma [Vibrio sp. SM6]|uniref:RecBCD enzyme subunit RecC n=1 Tax=Vibrio agarilyticus TaxID=2726741 RepID=A0A7X8YH09_9VIBR|nr:exodeoxyribonuclease V subunit gamma [Vibrio agarilyticus]
MFTVYHSNQVELLTSVLVALIQRAPLDNPFESEQILVQSPGMSQWLKMALAKELGVAANLNFPLPATFIWQMFVEVLPEVPVRSAFNKEAMTWKLMQLLPEKCDDDAFASLTRYLDDDIDGTKRYQLAEKIADIYDGYLVYRPEWIAAWERNETVAELEDEHPWQPILWRELTDATANLNQSRYHRANLYQDFIDALAQPNVDLTRLPKRLFVFGITSLPPRYMDALRALGQHIDVHLMFTNPCRYYWGEVRDRKFLARLAARHRQQLALREREAILTGDVAQLKPSLAVSEVLESHMTGNSLLASMGKLGRDNLFLLAQAESNEIDAFVEIPRDNLLHHLQADILDLEEHQDDTQLLSSAHKPMISPVDSSLTVHVCHSAMREVEVLHDQLLARFDADPNLKPRDIIVMVADINAYSPAIQAVFGNAPGERYIPFSISDRTATQESPILAAFLQLLALPTTRCLASELLELLETPAILRRFGMDQNEFNQAKQWVELSGVRWGLDSQTASEFSLPSGEQNTWQFGISRMLLGYAMVPEAGLFATAQGDIAPFNDVQGLSAELAGKLAHYIETIAHYRKLLVQTHSAELWQQHLSALLEDCFSVELEGEMALKSIRDTLGQLAQQVRESALSDHFDAMLSPAVVSLYLNNKLSGTRVSQRFLAGQVNFCTLMPMRSIPFHTVCLLGMNDGVYPRSMPPEGFDLMNGRGKPGDRSRRDDDRYLFLEALLSAQQALYISYVGRSIQDNSTKVPSVLVAELLEYCQQNYALQGDEALSVDESGTRLVRALTQYHAMVPFAPSAFGEERRDGLNHNAQSYAKEWLPAVNRQGVASGAFNRALTPYLEGAVTPLLLDWVELQRFWRLPVQYFFNRRLKVVFEPPLPVAEDDEPFVLSGLDSYQMRDALLETKLAALLKSPAQADAAAGLFKAQQRAEGKLPVGAFGEIEFDANRAQIDALLERLHFVTQAPRDDIEINLSLSLETETETKIETETSVQLQGWLTQYYQAGLIRYRSGRLRAQDQLSAWLDHLAMNAAGFASPTHMIGYDRKKGVVHWVYPPLASATEARSELEQLVALFYQGMDAPLAYFPSTALANVEAGIGRSGVWQDDEDKALKKMAETFNPSYLSDGEGSNVYIQRIWPKWDDDLAKQVRALSQRVLQTPRLYWQDQEEASRA